MIKNWIFLVWSAGAGGTGVSSGYVVTSIMKFQHKTIEEEIIGHLGRKLISSSPEGDRIFEVIYKENESTLKQTGLFNNSGEIWRDDRGAEILKTWCGKALKFKLIPSNTPILQYIIQWCVIRQTVQHKLLEKGRQLFSKDEEYSSKYSEKKDDSTFKSMVIKKKNQDGKVSLKSWCDSIFSQYADHSEDSQVYLKAHDWCSKPQDHSKK